jgi:hypothetical protein
MEVIPPERPELLTAGNHGHLDLTHVKTEEMSFNLSLYPEDMDHKYTDLNRTTLWTEDKTLICSTKENTERRLRLGQEISFSGSVTNKDCKTADLMEHLVGNSMRC